MPDTHEGLTSEYRRQRTAAAQLRERLAALGLPAERVSVVTPMSDMRGRPYIHVGTLPLDVIEGLLAVLSQPVAEASARGSK